MSGKKAISLIVAIWVIAGIAIALTFRWASGSPSLETLIAVNISIGIAILASIFTVLVNLFTIGMRIINSVNSNTDKIVSQLPSLQGERDSNLN